MVSLYSCVCFYNNKPAGACVPFVLLDVTYTTTLGPEGGLMTEITAVWLRESISPHAVHKLKEATTLKLSGITFVVALSTYHQCTTHPLTTRSEGELQDTAYVASARNYHLCDACLARRTYSVSPAQHNREREPWNMPLQPFEQLELTFGELTCLDIGSSCTSVPYRLSVRL